MVAMPFLLGNGGNNKMNRDEWNKFVKVFTLDVDVSVKKEVSKADVILSLLDENEIAFNGKNGKFVIKISDKMDAESVDKLILSSIRDAFKTKLLSESSNE